MFYFPECVPYVIRRVMTKVTGFPHSDIYGSKITRHLPVAYRRHVASFITSLESRHPPYALKFPIRKLKNHNPERGRRESVLHFHDDRALGAYELSKESSYYIFYFSFK